MNMKQSGTLKARPIEKTHRQVSKPLMERRRRARINGCLGELRTLLLQSHIAQSCRRSKMEKADILELTVRHLKALKQSRASGNYAEISKLAMSGFYAGYSDCAMEVGRFLSKSDGMNNSLRGSLLHRLSDRATALATGATPLINLPGTADHRSTLECTPEFSCVGSSLTDSHLLASLQYVIGGQPIIVPVANSAFSFPLHSSHHMRLVPESGARPMHGNAVLGNTAYDANSSMSETVWRPW